MPMCQVAESMKHSSTSPELCHTHQTSEIQTSKGCVACDNVKVQNLTAYWNK